VISRSGVVISITNCYIRLTFLLTYCRSKQTNSYCITVSCSC